MQPNILDTFLNQHHWSNKIGDNSLLLKFIIICFFRISIKVFFYHPCGFTHVKNDFFFEVLRIGLEFRPKFVSLDFKHDTILTFKFSFCCVTSLTQFDKYRGPGRRRQEIQKDLSIATAKHEYHKLLSLYFLLYSTLSTAFLSFFVRTSLLFLIKFKIYNQDRILPL